MPALLYGDIILTSYSVEYEGLLRQASRGCKSCQVIKDIMESRGLKESLMKEIILVFDSGGPMQAY